MCFCQCNVPAKLLITKFCVCMCAEGGCSTQIMVLPHWFSWIRAASQFFMPILQTTSRWMYRGRWIHSPVELTAGYCHLLKFLSESDLPVMSVNGHWGSVIASSVWFNRKMTFCPCPGSGFLASATFYSWRETSLNVPLLCCSAQSPLGFRSLFFYDKKRVAKKLVKALSKMCTKFEANNPRVYIFGKGFWWLSKKPAIMEMSLLSMFLIFVWFWKAFFFPFLVSWRKLWNTYFGNWNA